MWPLTNGLQCLGGDEAGLFRGAVGMMLDQLVFELNASPSEDEDSTLNEDLLSGDVSETSDYETSRWSADPDDIDLDEELDEELDSLVEGFGFETPHLYSMWEPEQRVWLLERVAVPMLTARRAPAAAAIYEATVEAIYVELADLIAMEITSGTPIEKGSWRGSLLDAYVQRCPKDSLLSALQFEATTMDPCLPPAIKKQLESIDDNASGEAEDESPENLDWMNWWTMVIERLVDATYGPRIYHDAEAYLDGDPRDLQRYLRTKGVNAKFIQRIPPLRTHEQTQKAIDRLQRLLFQN